jgi:DNA-binding transcriptional regulator PaaX
MRILFALCRFQATWDPSPPWLRVSARALAIESGLGEPAVRLAIRRLEAEGVLEVYQEAGFANTYGIAAKFRTRLERRLLEAAG